MPFDWYARQMVESHVTVEFMRSAPVPRVPDENQLRQAGHTRSAGRLAAVDHRYAHWAGGIGVQVGSVSDEATKQDLIAELDAVVALLYGLSRPDVEHIFATFHRGWDYRPRLAAVLAHYDRWAALQREDGEPVTGPSAEDADFRPTFATNRPSTGETVADALNDLLHGMRTHLAVAPPVAIATAFFNPGGFRLLADELEQVGPVRLLLGAEPDPDEGARVRPLAVGRGRQADRQQLRRALEDHSRGLTADRDLVGFTREADADARRLVAWLRGQASGPDGTPRPAGGGPPVHRRVPARQGVHRLHRAPACHVRLVELHLRRAGHEPGAEPRPVQPPSRGRGPRLVRGAVGRV